MDQSSSSSTLPRDPALPSNGLQDEQQSGEEEKKRPPRWTIWRPRDSIEIDLVTTLKMLKGGLPPTIVIAM